MLWAVRDRSLITGRGVLKGRDGKSSFTGKFLLAMLKEGEYKRFEVYYMWVLEVLAILQRGGQQERDA